MKKKGGQQAALRVRFWLTLGLWFFHRFLLRRRPGGSLPLSFTAADQSQSISRVEGEHASRRLASRAQSDVDPAIARHPDRDYVPEHPLTLFRAEIGVIRHRILHLGIGQVVSLAKPFSLDVCLGNTLFDQEGLGAVDTTLGERLIVFHGATVISVASENQVRVRLCFEIPLEVGSQHNQCLLLTGQQTAFGIRGPGVVDNKIDAVQSESGFQDRDLGGWWWILHCDLG